MHHTQVLSSRPPRPTPAGAIHTDLIGAREGRYRFRSRRVRREALPCSFRCTAVADKATLGPFEVIDVGEAGAAFAPGSDAFTTGQALSQLTLHIDDAVVFDGSAVVVHASPARVGVRLIGPLLDLERLELRARLAGRGFGSALERHQRHVTRLPMAWRAAVAEMQHLLASLERALGQFAKDGALRHERELIEESWKQSRGTYFDLVDKLARLSAALPEAASEDAREYAHQQLYPLVRVSPVWSRCYEKPRGYAGDFKLMELCTATEYVGETLYARFMHHACLDHTLVRSISRRVELLRDVLCTDRRARSESRALARLRTRQRGAVVARPSR